MSGIVGIINLDRAPVDRALLQSMTDFMSFRGPDAQEIWIDGHVGFGHTMLRTTFEAETENQPLTLDGKIWLTADARIDGRAELIGELERKLRRRLQLPSRSNDDGTDFRAPNDAELILYAYEAWGEDCVKHILGDFVFALWDDLERRLFCARDHLGVRQFYYAQTARSFVFSNTLSCLRVHPDVSSELNEVAIGDFLLFGLNQDRTSTTFADIQRLPQGHSLSWSSKGLAIQEYWAPQVNSVPYKSADDRVGRFKELLVSAVNDRLRTNSAGVSFSGGMDSSTVAALAVNSLRQSGDPFKLKAFCVVYDDSFADQERQYATIAAEALNIPVEFLQGTEFNRENNRRTERLAPEPFNVDPIYVVSDELLSRISSFSRVALTGWDGDTFMSETPRYHFAHLFRGARLGKLAIELMRYLYFQRQPPPIGLRSHWRQWKQPEAHEPPFPTWLNEEFSARLGLRERWERVHNKSQRPHPTRPRAFGLISSPDWRSLFARFDAGATLRPLEVRHPLIDVRVIEYLLAIPIIPWLLDKAILRSATSGLLPDEVRLRPKTPLAGDPGVQLKDSKKLREIDAFVPWNGVLSYIRREAIPKVAQETDSNKLWLNVRPHSLNQWLMHCSPRK